MSFSRRHLLAGLAASGLASTATAREPHPIPTSAPTGPAPLFEKSAPISVADLDSRRRTAPVLATEVHDFTPFGYPGPFTPSPPHADLNPQRAIIITFRDHPQRFVFSHEASYVPWFELPEAGVGLCNQFYETSKAAELFNDNGRKTRNSSVDILDPGPSRVWIRWNYICTHPDDDEHAKLRGTEDYVAYPNGLIWRRMTYQSLSPDEPDGYSWQPIDFFCPVRADSTWDSLFPRDPQHNDYFVGSVLDAYSPRHYDKFWDDAGHPRRIGDPELLLSICRSQGLAIVAPFKAGHLFTALGPASGFPPTAVRSSTTRSRTPAAITGAHSAGTTGPSAGSTASPTTPPHQARSPGTSASSRTTSPTPTHPFATQKSISPRPSPTWTSTAGARTTSSTPSWAPPPTPTPSVASPNAGSTKARTAPTPPASPT